MAGKASTASKSVVLAPYLQCLLSEVLQHLVPTIPDRQQILCVNRGTLLRPCEFQRSAHCTGNKLFAASGAPTSYLGLSDTIAKQRLNAKKHVYNTRSTAHL